MAALGQCRGAMLRHQRAAGTRSHLRQGTTASAQLTAVQAPAAPAASIGSSQPPVVPSDLLHVPSAAAQGRELRRRLCREHLAGGLIYITSGKAVPRNGLGVCYRFRPRSDFAYLMPGVEEPGASLLMDVATGHTTLLMPKQDPDAAFWMGPQPSLQECAEEAGVERAAYTSDLAALLREHAKGRDVHVLGGEDADAISSALNMSSDDGGAATTVSGQPVRVLDSLLKPVLHRLRAVKTRAEMACLMRASQVSAAAHMAAWAAGRPGTAEYQMEAAFTGSCMAAGLPSLGYPCIVGSGPNAAILHYGSNRKTVGPQDLVLIDAGAEFRCYTADITRTFPAAGVFTPQQRDLYTAVLDSQELALSLVRPGALLKDVDSAARKLLIARLQDLGLVSRKASVEALQEARIDRTFMPHGLGHFLGLDVHDVSDDGPAPKAPLQPGNVITIEPGLYMIPALLARAKADPAASSLIQWDVIEDFMQAGAHGVRIEDNVCILQPGSQTHAFNLTTATGLVPKGASEMEAAIRELRRV